jgi:predicted O-methyltransferase YrrM
MGFDMASDPELGSLLRSLATSKPNSALLELGTGTGLSTAWIVDGMHSDSTLLTIDRDERVTSVAQEHLGHDPRVRFVVADGADYLLRLRAEKKTFALVFADAWAGKYHHLDEALQLLAVGGIYVVDDLNPQPNWPEDHPAKVADLVETLVSHPDLHVTTLEWSTGIALAARVRL